MIYRGLLLIHGKKADFGLIDRAGRLLSNPVCYRDSRTQGVSQKAEAIISKKRHVCYHRYSANGDQYRFFN